MSFASMDVDAASTASVCVLLAALGWDGAELVGAERQELISSASAKLRWALRRRQAQALGGDVLLMVPGDHPRGLRGESLEAQAPGSPGARARAEPWLWDCLAVPLRT